MDTTVMFKHQPELSGIRPKGSSLPLTHALTTYALEMKYGMP